jgi:ribosomal protein S1
MTIHNIKPGYLINGKVSKVLDNGIEVSFLGGFTGSVFVDHLGKDSPSKYSIGEKIIARIISVDPSTLCVSLSCLEHLVNFTNFNNLLLSEGISVGQTF